MANKLWVLILLLAGISAPAQTVINLTPSMNTAAINSAISGQNNSTINFAAGTYTITSQLNVPCINVVINGPTIPNLAHPTAILNGSSIGTSGVIMGFGSGCNGLTIKNLWFENAGWIYANSGNNNITLTNNTFTGLPDIFTSGDCCDGPNGVEFHGDISRNIGGGNGPTDSNIAMTYNSFGDSTSCPNSFSTGEVNSACTAVWMQPGTLTNFTFNYNLINHVNEGLKFAQTTSGPTPTGTPDNVYTGSCVVDYNFFDNIHRISFENQFDAGTTCNIDHDAILLANSTYFGTLTFSMACCTWSGTFQVPPLGFSPGYTTNDMMMVSNQNPGGTYSSLAPFGVEYWGINPQMIGSSIEGYFPNGVAWNCANNSGYTYPPGTSTSCLIQNTYICLPPGDTTFQNSHWSGFITDEEGGSPPPTQVNNNLVTSSPGCSTQTSAAPTISPASGSFSGQLQISMNDTGTNTSIWYTTDGSSPVPGNGSATLYNGAFNINGSGTTTIKAVGMWGVPPQPTSWPSGYGWVPSSTITSTFTNGGGAPSAATPTASPVAGTYTSSQSVTLADSTSGSTIYYTTDGTTPTTSSTVYSGAITVSSSQTIKAIATASGFSTSATLSAAYLITTPGQAATPTFSPLGQTYTVTPLSVAVSDTTASPTIYCTTDGTTPTTSSPVYTGPFSLGTTPTTTTIKCIATAGGFTQSAVGTAVYSYSLYLGNNQENDNAGTYAGGYLGVYAVTGSNSTGYTVGNCIFNQTTGTVTNGSNTDCAIILAPSGTTEATSVLCHATYTNTSATGNTAATVSMASCPILPPSTAYWVSINTNDPLTPSAYGGWNCGGTCSGSLPTQNNGTYPGYFVPVAYGTYTGLPTAMIAGSDQFSQYVTLTNATMPTAAIPTISPTGGSYTSPQTVTLADSTAGAMIHYTTDGTTPTSGSPTYTSAFTVSSTTTVKAIAIATGFTNSSVATAIFNFGTFVVASVKVFLNPVPNCSNCVLPGGTAQFYAQITYTDSVTTAPLSVVGVPDARGNSITNWASSNPLFGTISTGGLFTGVSYGITLVTATVTGGTTGNSVETVSQSVTSGIIGGNLQ